MRGLHWDGEQAKVVDRPRPDRGERALVRVQLAGVCATDLEITRGYMDFRGVLGHEFVGLVDEGPADWTGARVVADINFSCGTCEACARGLGRHCANRSVMGILNADGAFAEYVAVPVVNLHRVPDDVSNESAVFSEPLAAAFEILDQVEIESGQRCIVFGDGRLGLLIAQVLATSGADVLAVGRHAEKLELLTRRGIATQILADWEVTAGRERADLVVEATGSSDGFRRAMAATRPRGTLVLKSTVADAPSLDLSPLVIDEITVVGSRCGRFEPALRALSARSVDVEGLIHERLPLESGVEALRRAAQPGVLKVLLDCS
jgi:threonine dehydrogenase-like Zn-dependent dehydrogenase